MAIKPLAQRHGRFVRVVHSARQARFAGDAVARPARGLHPRHMNAETRPLHSFLRPWRKKLGLSQEHVANRLSVEHTTISRWERGLVPLSSDQLSALATVYGITIMQLLSPPEHAEMVDRLARIQAALDKMDPDEADAWVRVIEGSAKKTV